VAPEVRVLLVKKIGRRRGVWHQLRQGLLAAGPANEGARS
jgi:hypothetical protein